MDALALVLVFLGLMALAFTYAATRPRPPSEFELAVRRISASIEDAQVAVGEALLPVVRKVRETFKGGPESLSQKDWEDVGRTMRDMYEQHPRHEEGTD